MDVFLQNVLVEGGDVENFYCPYCYCTDRERHLILYFDALDIWSIMRGSSVLHFAPEPHVAVRIRELSPPPLNYVQADITSSSAAVEKINVTQIPYENNSFEIVICNHVLEYVADDRKAMREIFRVLKPGGTAILQTPYSRMLQGTLEDAGIATPELRRFLYGEGDHIRLYGQDLFQRLSESGFELKITSHDEALCGKSARVLGISHSAKLIMVR